MKTTALTIGAMIAAATTFSAISYEFPQAQAATAAFPASVTCTVVWVIDGDTIKCVAPELNLPGDENTCEIAGKKTSGCWSVRLARIDTGETTYVDSKAKTRPRWLCDAEHRSGKHAKFLTELLVKASGNVVALNRITDDYYDGRRVAEVWVAGGYNLSDILLTLDLAVEYNKRQTKADRKKLFCPDAQTAATE